MFSEFARSNAENSLEGTGKVTLVKETGCSGNLANGGVQLNKFAAGEFDAALSYIRADGAPAGFAKCLSEINRMRTCLCG